MIRLYTNTKCEYDLINERLNYLIDKKVELFHKYFPTTTRLKKEKVDGHSEEKDNMVEYLVELNEIDLGTGMSIQGEIDYQQEKLKNTKEVIDNMNLKLKELKGIEYELYYKIVVEGLSISKAVSKVAEKFDKDEQTIWKNYYRNIKNDIKRLKYTVKIQ